MSRYAFKHKVDHEKHCLMCGKKVEILLDGMFCGEDCAAKYVHGILHTYVHCNRCGKSFFARRNNSRFCPECVQLNNQCVCFYPYRSGHISGNYSPCPPVSRRKKKLSKLDEIARICNEEGISYGEYQKREILNKMKAGASR